MTVCLDANLVLDSILKELGTGVYFILITSENGVIINTKMKIEIDNVEEVIDGTVESYSTSTRISIPKKYAKRKVKIIILREE